MASIRARVGATNAIKVIASNSLSGSGSKLSDISDVDTSTQSHRFLMTYNANTQKYEFVDPDVILIASRFHCWNSGWNSRITRFVHRCIRYRS